ncbi:hypothetical protein BDZ89DRAFT_1165866 [Hymenopellis radicata]|nr:hypothetical protein BDZ89DRAFT_1165866 [Hymenopellis radicata]
MPRYPRNTYRALSRQNPYVLQLHPPNRIARRELAFLVVHQFLSESNENRDLVISEIEYDLIFAAVFDKSRVTHAKQSVQRLIDTAQVRDGALYVGTAPVVSEKALSQALVELSFCLDPEEMVHEAAARYRGLPEDLVRVWHASLLLLAIVEPAAQNILSSTHASINPFTDADDIQVQPPARRRISTSLSTPSPPSVSCCAANSAVEPPHGSPHSQESKPVAIMSMLLPMIFGSA